MSSTNLRFIKMVYALGIILVVMFMGCAQQVHEHVYKDTVIAPTCAEKGYTLHKCQTCGDEYKDSYIPMVDHTFEDKEITKNATCTESGKKVVVCNICKDELKVEIPALGHNFNDWSGLWNPSKDENMHKRKCRNEGCTISENGNHIDDDGDSVCDICKAQRRRR